MSEYYNKNKMNIKHQLLGCLLFIYLFFFIIYFLFFVLQELPINIKFCFEGMEESGSEGLDDLVFSRKDTFFKDVDYVCISDNYWLGKTKPCITYGLRGICYFFLEVRKRFLLSVYFVVYLTIHFFFFLQIST